MKTANVHRAQSLLLGVERALFGFNRTRGRCFARALLGWSMILGAWGAPEGRGQERVMNFAGDRPAGLATPAAPQRTAPIRLLKKAAGRVDFDAAAEWCWATEVQADGERYTRLALPGGGRRGEIGEPELPCHGQFIEVPDGAAVRLVIDHVDWLTVDGAFNLMPRQPPPTDLAGGKAPPFAKSAAAYGRAEFFPAQPVQIDEQVRVRGHALVHVSYLPAAYDAARQMVKVARQVQWHLEFVLPKGAPAARRDGSGQRAFAPVLRQVLDARPDAAGGGAPGSGGSAGGTAGLTGAQSSSAGADLAAGAGADYLIITHDNFYGNILPLANWKHAKGYQTRVVKLSEISATPNCTNITAYIQNAYNAWNPAPTYVLLVGDAQFLPAWYKTPHSYYGANTNAATDLYYAAVDGADYFPDVFLGRLPCATTAECDVMVNKILQVEKTPDPLASIYQTVLTAGQFTDDNADSYEDRIFVETAEAVRDFYVTKGYTVPTAYCADTTILPRHYNSGSSLMHTNGAVYGGSQTYVSTSAGSAAITNAIHSGVCLVQHRDHGSRTGGWATPPFSPTMAKALTNGTRLPVIMSINCETAWYDGPSDSLAEALVKDPNGGSHCVIGASRVSYSWHNDWFVLGLYECMYTNFFETLSTIPYYKPALVYGDNLAGHGTHIGQMLNFGKMLMYDKEGPSTTTQIEFDILTLLGDPEQSPRLAAPQILSATHPAHLMAGAAADFDVTVTGGGSPLAGALVALVLDPGDYHTATTDGSGVAHFSFTPQVPGTNNLMSVTVSHQNGVPYQGIISVDATRLTVTLPAASQEGDGVLAGQGKVTVEPTPAAPLTVTLSSSDTSEVTVPASVLIPAGQSNACFDVTIVDDADLDGTQIAVVQASATGYLSGSSGLAVYDNETAALFAHLPANVREGDGTVLGSVFVSDPPAANVVVNLSSSDPTELQVPATVTILAGELSASFSATVVDDNLIDGPQPVTVTAQVQNWTSGSVKLTVLDNEPLTLTVGLPASAYESAGLLSNAGKVCLAGTLPTNLTVLLTSSNAAWLTVPASVTVPAGQTSAVFSVTLQDDLVVNETRTGIVIASAGGFTNGVAGMNLLDDDLLPAPSNPVPADGASNVAQALSLSWQSGAMAWQVVTNEVYFGVNPTPGAGELAGTTTNASWSLPPLAPLTTYYWQVVAHRVGSAASPVWSFTTKGVDHYAWSAIASPQNFNQSFNVTLAAKDEYNTTVSNFSGAVGLQGYIGSPTVASVIISEVDTDAPDAAEFVNVSDHDVDISGWQITTYDWRSWPGPGLTFVIPANTICPAGGVFQLTESAPYPGAYPIFQAGTNISWNNDLTGNPVAVLLRDQAGNIMDFMCAVGANPAQITSPVSIPADQWRGSAVPGTTNYTLTYQRVGKANNHTNTDWVLTTPSMGGVNAGLTLPFAGLAQVVAIAPTNSGAFVNGTWTGDVTVLQPAANMSLAATDAAGHRGISGVFDVLAANDLSVTVTAQPEPVVAGTYLTNTMVVANSGPGTATGVTATNFLPSSATFISASTSQGSWALAGSRVECNLGVLASGATAGITIVSRPGSVGTITNSVGIGRAEADAFAGNNTASAATTVVGAQAPAITTQPAPLNLLVGQTGQFTAAASGSPTLRYQWYKDGTALTDSAHWSGTASNVLTVSNAQMADNGNYYVRVTNSWGSVTSSWAMMLVSYVPLACQWQQTFGGSGSEYLWSVAAASDGGFLLAGYSGSDISGNKTAGSYGTNDYWVVKVDAEGNKLWEQSYGSSMNDFLRCVLATPDGGFLLGGYSYGEVSGSKTSPNYGFSDYWVIKIDGEGNRVWDQTYGGTGSEYLYCMTATGDGGYLLGGYSGSPASGNKTSPSIGGGDFWVVKIDADGNVVWDQVYGGTSTENLYSMTLTADDGFLLGGYSYSGVSGNKSSASYGQYDFWAVRIDASGTMQWDRSFGCSTNEFLYAVAPALDGGFLLGGYSYLGSGGNKSGTNYGFSDFWVVKVDASGNKVWDQTYGGSSSDILYCILPDDDGGFLLGGSSASGVSGNRTAANYGSSDMWIVKVGPDGTMAWDQAFGGTGAEYIQAMTWAADGGLTLVGHSSSGVSGMKTSPNYGGYDYWVLKAQIVESPPLIVGQPQNQYATVGSVATFSVTAMGSPPMSYQWVRNGTNLVSGGRFSGATSNVLNIATVQATDAGNYSVIVSNPLGTATSQPAALAVIASKTWLAGHGQTNTGGWQSGYWNAATNWAGNAAPVNGDLLNFASTNLPFAGAAQFLTNNFAAGMEFSVNTTATNIYFSGNRINASGQFLSNSGQYVSWSIPVALVGAATLTNYQNYFTNRALWELNGKTLTFGTRGGVVRMAGGITNSIGTAGIIASGTGTLQFYSVTQRWNGDTLLTNGAKVQLVTDNAFPAGPGKGNVILAPGNNTIFDLYGYDVTVNGVIGDGLITNFSSASGGAIFNLGSNNWSGTVGARFGQYSYGGALHVTKVGQGTIILTNWSANNGNYRAALGGLVLGHQHAISNGFLNLEATNGGWVVYSNAFGTAPTTPWWGGIVGSKNYGLTNMQGAPLALTLGTTNIGVKTNVFSGTNTYAGALTGTGASLTKTGKNAQELLGANTFGGALAINSGKLVLGTGHLGANATTVADGATLAAALSVPASTLNLGTLTLGSGGAAPTLEFQLGGNGRTSAPVVAHVGTLAINTSVQINVSGYDFKLGAYRLLNWDAGAASLSQFALASLPAGMLGNLSVDASTLYLNVTRTPNIAWGGSTNDGVQTWLASAWDINTTTNWVNADAGGPQAYLDDMSVFFNDTAATNVVVLATSVAPATLSFSNNALAYTLANGGLTNKVTRTMAFIKDGAGALTNAVASNIYSGATLIKNGAFILATNEVIPDGTGRGQVTNNGVLDLNGFSETVNGLFGGGVVDNSSALPSQLRITSNAVFNGVIRNSGAGPLRLMVPSTAGRLTLTSANTYSGGTSNYTQLVAGNDAAFGTGPVAMLGGGLASINAEPRVFANDFVFSSSYLTFGDATNNGRLTFLGAVNLASPSNSGTYIRYFTNPPNCEAVFAGVMTNGGVYKCGPGRTIFSNQMYFATNFAVYQGEAVFAAGSRFTNRGVMFRVDCVLPNSMSQVSIQPGAIIEMQHTNATLFVGSIGYQSTSTNFLTLAGTFRMPNADGTNGRIVMGRSGTPAVMNLQTGGVATVRSVTIDPLYPTAYTELNFDGGTLQAMAGTNNFIIGLTKALVCDGGAVIDTAGFNLTNRQALLARGTGGLTKNGTGILALSNVNTYVGDTLVNGGTLALLTPDGIASSAAIVLSSGTTLNVAALPQPCVLPSGQTLCGLGQVFGQVTHNGRVSPGMNSLGTLSFSSDLTLAGTTVIELNKNLGTNDVVAAAGVLTYGGTLIATNVGSAPIAAGDTFKIFQAGLLQGSFSSLPPPGPGLNWQLLSDGSLQAVAVNRVPVPGSPVLTRLPAGSAKAPVADFLGTDPDGDPVSLTSVTPWSVHGGSVTQTGNWVYYTPPAGFTNNDTFTFTVSDGRGGNAVGTASVLVSLPTPTACLLRIRDLGSNAMQLEFEGIPGYSYSVQYANSLLGTNWLLLQTIFADGYGACCMQDNCTNSTQRVYRVVRP